MKLYLLRTIVSITVLGLLCTSNIFAQCSGVPNGNWTEGCTYSISNDVSVSSLSVKSGTGVLIIDLEDTYTYETTGNLTVKNGETLVVKGNLKVGGSFSNHGYIYVYGSIEIAGAAQNQPSSRIKVGGDIDIAGAASDHDVVRAGGTITSINIFGEDDYIYVSPTDDDFLAYFPSFSLPVELSAFNVTKVEEVVAINWTTASEINSAYFDVQRSTDKRNWETIERVNAQGNSDVSVAYQVNDNIGNLNEIYYRLYQIDLDGAVEIFGPLQVKNNSSNLKISTYPNPITSSEKLSILIEGMESSESCSIIIYDTKGKLVLATEHEVEIGSSIKTIDTSMLTQGLHFVKISIGKENEAFKLLVSK
ncbi:T9SS type A sorting domain-containing protein [Flammeovirga pectinis]|uniref:T9SS type A sorting domain-containing protein n=1 Tax=Flammeovirga pectinis TaxID=2494373 RepID=A0A3Q9FSH7_9BACT|nr:T9SS type A sorting domain-containing protein [Flammeovirga pectinis]AZQ63491.1 T9SS type A sorting domain-containing protein [Flammeovirga pectinis]